MSYRMLLLTALFLLAGAWAFADESPEADDGQRIEAEVAAYVEAFNAKDAAALSKHWSEAGVYVRPHDGTRLVGRAAIEKEFAAVFSEQPEAVLAVKVDTIRFVTSDVAIEEGTAEVTLPDNETSRSRSGYAAVHVKRDGQWQVDSIRETELPDAEEETGGPLRELNWLVGDWADKSEGAAVETSVAWTKNKTFLSYAFKVSAGDLDDLEGTQVVGWDPARKTVRSWMFDSDGGFGVGVWTRTDNRWEVKLQQVLQDGRTASSTNVYTYIDGDTFTWQSVDREVDGESLPDVEPVTLARKPAAQVTRAESK